MLPTLTRQPDYSRIESGIRDTVRAINKLGIYTYSSCEGHLRLPRPLTPYIMFDMKSSPHESLCILMLAVGELDRRVNSTEWIFEPANEIGNGSPFVGLTTKFSGNGDPDLLEDRQEQMRELIEIIDLVKKNYC